MTKRTTGKAAHTPIPGWHDLLPYIQPLNIPAAEAKRAGRAASNLIHDVTRGLSAIGELTWVAGANENLEVSPETVANLGIILQNLAELVVGLRAIESGASIAQELAGGVV